MAKNTKERATAFADRLEHMLGDNLVSMLLYGPAVRQEGGGVATTLLVLRNAGAEALRPIEDPIKDWTRKRNPPPLIFAEHEWRASADVFPIEIEDMREAHLLLKGTDPLEEVQTTREDLRRELEREARGKLLQLRTEFAASAADGKSLTALLEQSARTFFVLFRAVLRLAGQKPPQDPRSLVDEIARLTDTDASAFGWVADRLSGEKTPPLKAHDRVGDRYLQQIEKIAAYVDTFDFAPADKTVQGGNQ